jgi:acetyltransferase-like isoleucine patch superfamily enzyme
VAARPYLDPRDHAFANGPVFPRPAYPDAARALFDRPEDGDRLLELFDLFDRRAGVADGLQLGLNARVITPAGQTRVGIGSDCVIRGLLRCDRNGEIEIGEGSYIGDGVILSAFEHIHIGSHCMLAHGVQVFDNDTHPTDAGERAAHLRAFLKQGDRRPDDFAVSAIPVWIGSRCWLGFGAAVMKGVTIDEETIVAAGAVVTSDVPARSIVAGNPARVVKSLDGRAHRGWLARLLGR